MNLVILGLFFYDSKQFMYLLISKMVSIVFYQRWFFCILYVLVR